MNPPTPTTYHMRLERIDRLDICMAYRTCHKKLDRQNRLG